MNKKIFLLVAAFGFAVMVRANQNAMPISYMGFVQNIHAQCTNCTRPMYETYKAHVRNEDLRSCGAESPLANMSDTIVCDTLLQNDSVVGKKKSFLDKVYEVVKEFSRVDENYIEPQHYNYTVMLQNTNTYESYTLRNKKGQEVVLAPEMSFRLGPYIGWRWLVLGYTIDVSHLFGDHRKQDWDISLYSNQVGVDLFYRRTGNDYKIRRMYLGEDIDTSPMKDIDFGGLNASIKGFNLYYIINHKRFSYPAAFNQSTCQKVSCGSPLVGIGYAKQSLYVDVGQLNHVISEHVATSESLQMDSSYVAARVNYTDFSVSGGYAYNWVFAKNWLAAASLSLAIAYKQSTGDMERVTFKLRDFAFYNLNFDGVGRFGVVWNNTRWYSGFSAILHSYTYRKSQFSTNSVFGSFNLYVGYNFGNRERHHQRKKGKY